MLPPTMKAPNDGWTRGVDFGKLVEDIAAKNRATHAAAMSPGASTSLPHQHVHAVGQKQPRPADGETLAATEPASKAQKIDTPATAPRLAPATLPSPAALIHFAASNPTHFDHLPKPLFLGFGFGFVGGGAYRAQKTAKAQVAI